jgi:hypothetical protein
MFMLSGLNLYSKKRGMACAYHHFSKKGAAIKSITLRCVGMKEDTPSRLEWEVLRHPVTVSEVYDIRGFPKGRKKIVVERDERHKLNGRLYAGGDFRLFLKERSDAIAGSFPELFDIQGSDESGSKHYTLESCIFGDVKISPTDAELSCEAGLKIRGFRVKYRTKAGRMWLTEWYINGPRDYSGFRNSPKVIKSNGLQFLVTGIPKTIGPDWSSNVRIEYRKDWGGIPDLDEREKISELCSFVFGRQLLLVGYTVYDKDGNKVEEYACNPWGNDPKSFCLDQYDLPPIRIKDSSSQGNAEEYISRLLPAYLELRNPLHLNQMLWFYWISRDMPLGTDLPILWAAVETIANSWFDYTKTSSHGVYMNKDEFEKLLCQQFEVIRSELKGRAYSDRILNRILSSYEMSITDRLRFFFEEIKLVVDKHEWNAILARHPIAHGQLEFEKVEWKLFVDHKRTYETLVHKILLKVLGYSGSYIDRSTLGWKDKQLV